MLNQPTPLCGCYYLVPGEHQYMPAVRKYLPQVSLKSHTTVVSPTSRTDLTQTFVNPSPKPVDEIRYAFPLYDGVSVVAFSCTIGERVIKGVVKEKAKAKEEYDAAKAQGHTAALMEQSADAGDVFVTTIGNVPAKAELVVKITYIGELKHDAQVDGLRFTIPTAIAPRYGDSSDAAGVTNTAKVSMSITVDVQLPEEMTVKSLQSPSHPISVSIGTLSTSPDDKPCLRRASATLALGTTNLDSDFVLQVVSSAPEEPFTFVETHPAYPDKRAIMASIVPRFNAGQDKPEIVFVCDRSGSMSNSIAPLIQALQVFLKSLPVGVMFNICSFGSSHSFLWPRSRTYDQATVEQAVRHISSFSANMGGTEMYEPIRETFKKRQTDRNLEVFVLTDGEIWDQDALFKMINSEVEESKGAIRVFSLGIGSEYGGASSSLVEGIARAGGGFSQMVNANEKLDKKVVRMLKASLYPHLDFTLQLKYGKGTSEDTLAGDEYDFCDSIPAPGSKDMSWCADFFSKELPEKEPITKRLISLFDRNATLDDDTKSTDEKFDDLPSPPPPVYLQTPAKMPGLFPFSRTTVYVLLSDQAGADKMPTSLSLQARTSDGSLVSQDIPITVVPGDSSTIHQLAARHQMKELEEGRGWPNFLTDTDGTLLKDKLPGRFQDLVQREGIRLGVEYQIVGKWTSFVAIDSDGPTVKVEDTMHTEHYATQPAVFNSMAFGAPMPACPRPAPMAAPMAARSAAAPVRRLFNASAKHRTSSAFGAAPPPPPGGSPFGGALFGSAPVAYDSAPVMETAVMASDPIEPLIERGEKLDHLQEQSDELASSASEFRRAAQALAQESKPQNSLFGGGIFKRSRAKKASAASADASSPTSPASASATPPRAPTPADPLAELTALQAFDGSWTWSPALEAVLGINTAAAQKIIVPDTVGGVANFDSVLATACAVAFLRKKLPHDAETWELMVEKAQGWVAAQGGGEVMKAAEGLF